MQNRNISCILILDNKKPVGIFTERDIVRSAQQFESSSFNEDIESFMTCPVLTAEKNKNVLEAYRLMEAHKIRHMVVVDDENQAVGVLTFTDLIEHLGYDYIDNSSELLDNEIMCPNVNDNTIQCIDCQLCTGDKVNIVVPVHGLSKNKVINLLKH